MYGKDFYHKTIRRYSAMFGSLFNDIAIQRMDKDGNVVDKLEVPVAYAPKEEYIQFIRQGALQDPLTDDDPNNDTLAQVQIILPRMSFELISFNYAADRMQSAMDRMRYGQSGESVKFQYMPVAYDFEYGLNMFVKHTDDALQILEQILPYFNPTVNWPVKNLPNMDPSITHDIAIEITSATPDIEYQGGAETEDRIIIFRLNFTLRGYLFRPTEEGDIIKKAIANYKDLREFEKPYEEQESLLTYTAEVNPETAGPNDPHTIDETIE